MTTQLLLGSPWSETVVAEAREAEKTAQFLSPTLDRRVAELQGRKREATMKKAMLMPQRRTLR